MLWTKYVQLLTLLALSSEGQSCSQQGGKFSVFFDHPMLTKMRVNTLRCEFIRNIPGRDMPDNDVLVLWIELHNDGTVPEFV
jgi:hypothetical protein